jgi:hypothetical protein
MANLAVEEPSKDLGLAIGAGAGRGRRTRRRAFVGQQRPGVVEHERLGLGLADPDVRVAQQVRRRRDCPGRKPAFLVFKRPARPYKSAIENRFT